MDVAGQIKMMSDAVGRLRIQVDDLEEKLKGERSKLESARALLRKCQVELSGTDLSQEIASSLDPKV